MGIDLARHIVFGKECELDLAHVILIGWPDISKVYVVVYSLDEESIFAQPLFQRRQQVFIALESWLEAFLITCSQSDGQNLSTRK